jgi:hypothetical protein
MRNKFIEVLVKEAKKNDKIVLIIGDLGYNVVEPFQEQFPERFFNAGICEQNMASMAAGLASEGFHVFIYSIANFPKIHIIFSDSEADKIPEFFTYAGKEYSHQVLPFYNEDDEINSYLEILGYDYENPAVIYLDNGNQIRFYDGTGVNAFNAEEFKKLFQ